MGVVDDFSIVRSEEDAKAYALRVKAFRVKAWGSEAYVPAGRAGAGARCALLVLVRAFRRTTKVPVHLDHPESYLQPSAQSALGDALLVAVKARGTQLLVETHSEHLLRRIQRRIAEGRACKDRVAVYYIEGRDHGAEIRELVIDECGGIANWPHEFFRDLNDDLAAIAGAAAQRRASRESAGAEQAEDAALDGGGPQPSLAMSDREVQVGVAAEPESEGLLRRAVPGEAGGIVAGDSHPDAVAGRDDGGDGQQLHGQAQGVPGNHAMGV
jgi:hypothetical protein